MIYLGNYISTGAVGACGGAAGAQIWAVLYLEAIRSQNSRVLYSITLLLHKNVSVIQNEQLPCIIVPCNFNIVIDISQDDIDSLHCSLWYIYFF